MIIFRKLRTSIINIFIIIFLIQGTAFALDPSTHRAINLHITNSTMNGFSLEQYLKSNLDFLQGIGEKFDGLRVNVWLELGGRYEDIPPWDLPDSWGLPYLRSVNHFHNPITDQGYSGFWGTGIMSGMSSTQWMLLPQNTQSSLCYLGCYSWYDVRDYYHKALTESEQNTRDTNFKEAFRGLGQLMHLIQDVSVPAHTREDGHLYYNYEKWVVKEAIISSYNPVFFSSTVNDIASFIDTNQYGGTNPDITTGTNIGLSEYANANFFSNDTNAIESTSFTYPQIPDDPTNIVEKVYVNNNVPLADSYIREYYKKNCCGETKGGAGYLLSAVDYFEYYRKSLNPLGAKKLIAPLLDSNVYEDYASLLIPRAIGYSAGLLNYFFRGEIEVVQVPNTDNIKIKNNSSEDMDGIFTLYYDAVDGNRNPVSDGSWYLPSLQAGDTSKELSFTEPTDFGEYKRYILVFKGTLGKEPDVVVGKIWSLCEEFKLTASDATQYDNFGQSVAISGDVAVVGAYANDDAGSSSGSAYVFVRNGNTWEEQAKLTASDAAKNDYFGYSVALSGDVAVVGAYRDDDAGSSSGSAYVFVRDGNTWGQQTKLTASDAAAGDQFGYSVAISGEVVIVGAERDDDAGGSSGSAYVFVRNGNTWGQQTKLTASDAVIGDEFGYSVAISGDMAIVGANDDDDAGSRSGSAYVFVRNGNTWRQQAKLTASDAAQYDEFGSSVAISGDVAVVGAYWDDDAGSASGSAYVFVRNVGMWEEQAKLTASDAVIGDRFGYSVAISGDVAVVGAYLDDDAGSSSGSAYVFVRDGNTWEEQAKLTASDAAQSNLFGYSVALSGDMVIVGAYGDDAAGPWSGSAYVYCNLP